MVSTIEFIKNMKERLPLNLQKESDVVAEEFISSVAKFINENNAADFDFVFKYALTGATCKMSLQGRFEIEEFLTANGIDVSEPFAAENIFVICSTILQIDSLPAKIIDEVSRKKVEVCVRELKSSFSEGFNEGFVEGICEAIA